VWLQGDKYAITPPAGATVATCNDQLSGRIYQAYRMPDGGYDPAYDLVDQCRRLYACYTPAEFPTLSEADKLVCQADSQSTTPADQLTLTLDDLRQNWTFHPLQFLLGKLELIRAMHASYDYDAIP
jgi:hypothetical protein